MLLPDGALRQNKGQSLRYACSSNPLYLSKLRFPELPSHESSPCFASVKEYVVGAQNWPQMFPK